MADALNQDKASTPFEAPATLVDETRAAAQGIRKRVGKHLTLYTDLPPAGDVDELPDVFEQAVPGWCEYFGIGLDNVASWRMTGFLMRDKERFEAAGLYPADLPPFANGYTRGSQLWLFEQPSAYYRRHLLLHEGTHGFMIHWLGGMGPPWYAEGLSELLGTHRWRESKLTLLYNPRSKDEVPSWGRVRVIQDQFAAGKARRLPDIMQLNPRAFLETEAYAWCWAAARFFDNHPNYREAFQALQRRLKEPNQAIDDAFLDTLRNDWAKVDEEWQLYIGEMEYGYDVARAAVEYQSGTALPTGGATVTIAADRGWQSTGILLQAGTDYEIRASGRYQIAANSKIWWCEPGGVTIHYYRGLPLGMLVGAVRDDDGVRGRAPDLATSAPIGQNRMLNPKRSGTLYLRVNESPAHLADNVGQLTVRIEAN